MGRAAMACTTPRSTRSAWWPLANPCRRASADAPHWCSPFPRTRHLARKLGILDAQNTRGHIQPPPPLTLRALYFCRGAPACEACEAEPTRGRPRQRDELPRAARICGGRLPRCRATDVLPPSGMRPNVRLGVSSPHGRPDRPAPLRPVRGRPELRPRRPGHARARPWRALCESSCGY